MNLRSFLVPVALIIGAAVAVPPCPAQCSGNCYPQSLDSGQVLLWQPGTKVTVVFDADGKLGAGTSDAAPKFDFSAADQASWLSGMQA